MEKQRYQVFRTLVYHYGDGVVTEFRKSLGYTWAVSEKARSATCVTASSISPSGKACMDLQSANGI